MNREEIIKLIKEVLEVEVQHEAYSNMWGEDCIETTVTLSVLGEVCSTSSDTVRLD